MDLPDYPQMRPLAIEDKALLDVAFRTMQPEISQYTFTNIFAWRGSRNTQVCRFEGQILIRGEVSEHKVLLQPIGEGDVAATIKKFLVLPEEQGSEFKYLPKSGADVLRNDSGVQVTEDRDNADYVYFTDDLVDLPGRKYDAKRNFINRFKSEHEYRYLDLSPDVAARCMTFEEHWCTDRSCQSDEGLSHEMEAVLEMLVNFEHLGYEGGAIEVDGSIAAFTTGEALNPETFVVHVEKADAKLAGIYAVINNEFCRHAAGRFKYVNREQDLGIPGLRQAKLSYHPLRIVETFRAGLNH
jgi:hypothetical protein